MGRIMYAILVVAFLAATPVLAHAQDNWASRALIERTVNCLNRLGPCDQAVIGFLAQFARKPGPLGRPGRDGRTPTKAEVEGIILDLIRRDEIKLPAGPQGPQGPAGTMDLVKLGELVDQAVQRELAERDRWWWPLIFSAILLALAGLLWNYFKHQRIAALERWRRKHEQDHERIEARLRGAAHDNALTDDAVRDLGTRVGKVETRVDDLEKAIPSVKEGEKAEKAKPSGPNMIGRVENRAELFYGRRSQGTALATVEVTDLPALEVTKEFANTSEPGPKQWAAEVKGARIGDRILACVTVKNLRATGTSLTKIRLRDIMTGPAEEIQRAYLKVRSPEKGWLEHPLTLTLPLNLDATLSSLHEALQNAELGGQDSLYFCYTFTLGDPEEGKPLPGEGKPLLVGGGKPAPGPVAPPAPAPTAAPDAPAPTRDEAVGQQ
jgi:hypothetical protein